MALATATADLVLTRLDGDSTVFDEDPDWFDPDADDYGATGSRTGELEAGRYRFRFE